MPPRKRQPAASDPPPPLPGGYRLGEKVFFTGDSQTFADGDKLVHGQQGEVTGPAIDESVKGKGVCVLFPGNTGNVDCYLTQVRRLRAASAATAPACAHTRDAAHAPCVPSTASAAAPQPSLDEQPRAPQPNAQRRSAGGAGAGKWLLRQRQSGPAMQAHPPSAGEPRSAAGAA